jgi:biopolymer transport protein TolQ
MGIPVLEMIGRAGWLARALLLLLAVESVISWAIVFQRLLSLRIASRQNRAFKKEYERYSGIVECENAETSFAGSPLASLARAAAAESRRVLDDAAGLAGVKEWSFYLQSQFSIMAERLDSMVSAHAAKLDRGVFFLAIISSSAPFLGLLGTVWGIMDSFYEIGQQGSASLPVVAPGIAEALIMTAIALFVAIPAVFFYNYLMHRVQRAEDEMDEFKDHLCGRVRREIFMLLYGGRGAGNQKQAQHV